MCSRFLIGNGKDMSFDFYKNIIDQVRPLKLSLNGFGEPLCNKDIFKMINYAVKKNINVVMTTNGVMINNYANELINSGLKILRVSMDSSNADIYYKIRRSNQFNNIVSGIEKIKRNLRVRLEFLILRENYKEITNFSRLAESLGISYVFFQILTEKDKTRKSELVGKINHEELKDILSQAIKLEKKINIKSNLSQIIERSNYIKALYKNENKFENKPGCCINPWFTTYITVDGDVWPCCRFGYRDIIVGNIKNNSFIDIWNNRSFQKFRKNLVKKKNLNYMCRVCDMATLFDEIKMRLSVLPGF
jgi:radical SAM protein with 4Fe4S-binding SPASM domain